MEENTREKLVPRSNHKNLRNVNCNYMAAK